MYAFDPVGDPDLTEAHKAKVIGLLAEMWGEQIDSVCTAVDFQFLLLCICGVCLTSLAFAHNYRGRSQLSWTRWFDTIQAVVEQRIFPHALAVSERGWSSAAHFGNATHQYHDAEFFGEAEGRLNHMSCTLNRRGIESSPSSPGHCSWSHTL
eukprot:COSAG02_NODE_19490_length_879_cov_1.193590_2_plen_152_part_00